MSAASGGNSEPKQGQRSQSARGFCPRSTMRVPQPDIIEHFGNADAVPQLPERCLSRKAGIVRCCLNRGLQKWPPPCRAASLRCCSRFYYIICFACVNGYFDEYYAGISSLLFTLFLCRFSFPSFFTSSRHSRSRTFILTYYPKVYLKSKNAGYFHFSAAFQQKSSGQQSASRCLPYYYSAPGCSAPLHLNYSSLSSGISSSKASIQLSLCHLSFSPFSLAATFCRCAWSFIMVPIGFNARSSIMW